jgi:hypothetical protein
LIDGTYLGFLLGSAASEPWHLQRFVLLWNVLLLLLLLQLLMQGICCLGQAQLATFCLLTTNIKPNDCSWRASTRTGLKLYTNYGHGRIPGLLSTFRKIENALNAINTHHIRPEKDRVTDCARPQNW